MDSHTKLIHQNYNALMQAGFPALLCIQYAYEYANQEEKIYKVEKFYDFGWRINHNRKLITE